MKKVLVVDDHTDIRRLLQLALGKVYAVSEASGAEEAWQQLERERPDAIIVDVILPGGMNGFQLCRKIRAKPQLAGIHIAMVSACGTPADRIKGRDVGADAYFVKPFSPIGLRDHLRAVIGE